MEKDAPGQDARQQFVALRQALGLPQSNLTLWAYVLRQPAIAVTAGVAAVLLLAALGVAAGPRLLARVRRHADDADDMAMALRLAREGGTLEPWMVALVEADEEARAQASAEATDKPAETSPSAQAQPAAASAPARPAGTATDPAKTTDKSVGEAKAAAKPDKGKPPIQTFPAETPPESAEEAEEEAGESLLAELFDGSDTLDARLEALAPLTEPVTPAELLELSASVSAQLRRAAGTPPSKGA